MDGPFHAGERELQRRAGVLADADALGRIVRDRVAPGLARVMAEQRVAVVASRDGAGRVWASLLSGRPGFVLAADEQLVRIAAEPGPGDPLAEGLAAHPELGVLLIDPEARRRIRLNGRAARQPEGIFLLVHQAYGNCPKYIQKRLLLTEDGPGEDAPRVGRELTGRQQDAVARADTFFIASFHPQGGADASHRGGRPGFVRVLGARRLAFDDHPGNGMFNTLGNLVEHPRAGLLFVDFEAGDLLHLTGRARVGGDFAVQFDVDEVRERVGACPLRWRLVESSPANPPLSRPARPGI